MDQKPNGQAHLPSCRKNQINAPKCKKYTSVFSVFQITLLWYNVEESSCPPAAFSQSQNSLFITMSPFVHLSSSSKNTPLFAHESITFSVSITLVSAKIRRVWGTYIDFLVNARKKLFMAQTTPQSFFTLYRNQSAVGYSWQSQGRSYLLATAGVFRLSLVQNVLKKRSNTLYFLYSKVMRFSIRKQLSINPAWNNVSDVLKNYS